MYPKHGQTLMDGIFEFIVHNFSQSYLFFIILNDLDLKHGLFTLNHNSLFIFNFFESQIFCQLYIIAFAT